MRFGLNVQNFGVFGDPMILVDLAHDAEAAGWDGFFLWDHLHLEDGVDRPFADPTVTVAAIAARTSRLRIGPLVTSPARRRPWKLAREIVSLDVLSAGRLTLGIGLGWADDDYAPFGETPTRKQRAERVNEALEILDGLQSGQPYEFHGEHFNVGPVRFLPRPVQERIPAWVAMTWNGTPNPGPIRRAARVHGVYPEKPVPHGSPDWLLSADDIRAILAAIREAGGAQGAYDVVVSGPAASTDRPFFREYLRSIEEAGATWYITPLVQELASLDELRALVRRGPWGHAGRSVDAGPIGD